LDLKQSVAVRRPSALSYPVGDMASIPRETLEHYELGVELDRLERGDGQLERERTQELLLRHLPKPPAVVLDIGGGPGTYACWLAALGYEVHLVDPVPLHIEQAQQVSQGQPDAPLASAQLGDARALPFGDGSADAVLLLGPLYHLTDLADRMQVLAEVRRVCRPGGIVCAAAISRFASTLDGLRRHLFDDPEFSPIAERGLLDGQHRNPSSRPDYFTTAYFHRPDELAEEFGQAALTDVEVFGIEGPGWLLPDLEADLDNPQRREHLFVCLRRLERETSLLGVSAHLLAVGRV
jgi:ubiquinone/menaquinone biosynthesis C-methylase UbiE